MENGKITCEIAATRYNTTLPLTLSAIINQSFVPDEIVIYLDGEQSDLHKDPIYQYLFKNMICKGIKYVLIATGGKQGQVKCHEHARNGSINDFIWRIDDDEVPEPNCLLELYNAIKDNPEIGAVAPLVLSPNKLMNKPRILDGKINQIYLPNIQWYLNNETIEVEHLYSTFLYRKKSTSPYNLNLSRIGFREETMFSHDIFKNGYKLIINHKAITWHYQFSGGVRDVPPEEIQKDHIIFENYLKNNNIKTNTDKFIVIACGLGDSICFKNSWNEIKKYYKEKPIIGCSYPEVFDDIKEDFKMIVSVEEILECFGVKAVEDRSIYKWMARREWKDSMSKAYIEFHKELAND